MRDGDTWFVVSAKWWTVWKEYAGYVEDGEDEGERIPLKKSSAGTGRASSAAVQDDDDDDDEGYGGRTGGPPAPGRITTLDLVKRDSPLELRPRLTEQIDYVVLVRSAVEEMPQQECQLSRLISSSSSSSSSSTPPA